MLGGIIALLAAASFGFNNAAIRRGVLSGSVLQAMSITVPMGVPFILIIAILTGQIQRVGELPMASYLLLGAAGILHFVWGRYCNYRSTRAMGGNLSGPWKQSNLILALILAIILLGETLTPLKVAGIGLIVFGVMATTKAARIAKKAAEAKEKADAVEAEAMEKAIADGTAPAPEAVAQDDAEARKEEPAPFKPNYTEGYTFALLSATGYGISPVMIRMALENTGPGFSVLGALVAYFSAAVVVGLIILIFRKWQHIREMSSTSIRWFSLAGMLVGTSQMLRFLALSIAPVTVVTPIQSTSNMFRVLFAWFINREHEVFGAWIFVGMFLTMFGVVALTVSTEMVLEYVPLPDFLRMIAGFEWP